jgi:predicted DCC family thiol-disulfide oxidoreductase YuxK
MMPTYLLLYNDHCPACRQLAALIDQCAGPRLTLLPIHSQRAIDLLGRARPAGWTFAPYLLRIHGESVCAWTGRRALWRCLLLLGPWRTCRLLWRARRLGLYLAPARLRRLFHQLAAACRGTARIKSKLRASAQAAFEFHRDL